MSFSHFTTRAFHPMDHELEFLNDMDALDLKEEAFDLQGTGAFEEALRLMQMSVALRVHSHTLCLSLSQLADLYLAMLKPGEATSTCRLMLREARRYDTAQQTRIAMEILHDVEVMRKRRLFNGMLVKLRATSLGLTLYGRIRGKQHTDSRYYIDMKSMRILLPRGSFAVAEDEGQLRSTLVMADQERFEAHPRKVLQELGGDGVEGVPPAETGAARASSCP